MIPIYLFEKDCTTIVKIFPALTTDKYSSIFSEYVFNRFFMLIWETLHKDYEGSNGKINFPVRAPLNLKKNGLISRKTFLSFPIFSFRQQCTLYHIS